MLRLFVPFIFAVCLCVTGFPASADLPENAVGQVKTLVSGVTMERGGAVQDAVLGGPVFEGDVVSTDGSGSVGITFKDGTVLSLGSDSQMAIDAFVFDPQDRKLGFGARFLKGTAAFLSGRIAKLAPEQVSLTTPYSTIGIRGTRILVSVGE